jgi:hypothetical protein
MYKPCSVLLANVAPMAISYSIMVGSEEITTHFLFGEKNSCHFS